MYVTIQGKFSLLSTTRFVMLGLTVLLGAETVAQSPAGPPQPREDGGFDAPRDRDGRRGFRGDGPGGLGGPGGPGATRGIGQVMEPEFLRRDLPLFVDSLDLDKSQTPIVETLFLDYESAFEEAASAMRDKFAAARPRSPETEQMAQQRGAVREEMRELMREMRELRESIPQDAQQQPDADIQAKIEAAQAQVEKFRAKMQQLRPQMPQGEELARIREQMTALGAEWRNTRQQLRNGFIGDVQTILTDEQRAAWPEFERKLRREKTLTRSQFAGEDVDLFHIIRDMDLTADETAVIEPALDQYSIALDAALVARNARMETQRGEMMAAMMERDINKAKGLASEEIELRRAVRNVNEQFSRQVAQALGDPRGAQFTELFVQRSFPRIHRPTFAQRSFDEALAMDGLTPEIIAAIRSVQEQYLAAVRVKNAELMAAIRDNEPKEIEMRVQFWAARINNEEPSRPENDLRARIGEDRFQLDQVYRKQLESLLTAEQIAKLPPVPEFRGGAGGPRLRFEGGMERIDPQQRQEFMQRFDRNSDGQIDDAEREAIRDAVRQRRGGNDPV